MQYQTQAEKLAEYQKFHAAFESLIKDRTVKGYREFSQRFILPDGTPTYVIGFGILAGEHAFVAGGAGCGGHDVQNAMIIKLSPDGEILEIIASTSEYL